MTNPARRSNFLFTIYFSHTLNSCSFSSVSSYVLFCQQKYSRTFKDIITFIPFVIIWSIPISPVGHALVFGAIQKFYPEFFPSSFTDQRQNLLQLYETTEFSEVIIKESLQERITRFFEALTFVVEKKLRNFYQQLTNGYSDETDDNNNSNVDES